MNHPIKSTTEKTNNTKGNTNHEKKKQNKKRLKQSIILHESSRRDTIQITAAKLTKGKIAAVAQPSTGENTNQGVLKCM